MNKLQKILVEQNFIKPNYNEVNLIDLVKTIYRRYGKDYEITSNVQMLNDIIPNNKHTLLILSDGTGANLIEKLDDTSILKKNKKKDLLTVFPSTTGCVLTSLVTATFPQVHGIWGWFNYNRKINRDYLPVLFNDRKSNKSLKEFNVSPSDIYKTNSVLKELNTKVNVIFPDYINDSVYSKFVADDKDRHPYSNYEDIIKFIKNNCENNESSYTYLYLPEIDRLEHNLGIDNDEVINVLNKINDLVVKLSENKDLTIIFTADHGQTNIDTDIVMDFAKYSKYFYAYPSIDCGTATYYVKKEFIEEFKKEFEKDFNNYLFLFETEDFISNNIFGIGEISKESLNNLGEFISLCKKGSYLINTPNTEDYFGKIKGNHSGLTKDEMIIPLIVIDTNNL